MFNCPTYSLYEDILTELTTTHTQAEYKDDIIELDDKFIIELELPGFQKSDIDMDIKKDALHVTVKKEVNESKGRYIHKSRSDKGFSKIYNLSDEVDREKIEATLLDGLLTITLSKGGEAQPQKIKIF